MTAWTAVAVFVLAGIAGCGLLRLWWVDRALDRHVAAAVSAANPACACDLPGCPGWLHSMERCVPPTPPCDCRGSLRDASGVMHDPVCCMPLRELMLDGRWGTP